jgi:hypothetical protein
MRRGPSDCRGSVETGVGFLAEFVKAGVDILVVLGDKEEASGFGFELEEPDLFYFELDCFDFSVCLGFGLIRAWAFSRVHPAPGRRRRSGSLGQ